MNDKPVSSSATVLKVSVPLSVISIIKQHSQRVGLPVEEKIAYILRNYARAQVTRSAGMKASRELGIKPGRPLVSVDALKVLALRSEHVPWRSIAQQLNIGTGTAVRAFHAALTEEEKAQCRRIRKAKALLRTVEKWLKSQQCSPNLSQ